MAMTFSQQTKHEIINALSKANECCAHACIYAMLMSVGVYSITRNGIEMTVSSDNQQIIDWANSLVERLHGRKLEVSSFHNNTLQRCDNYTIYFDEQLLLNYQLVYYDEDNCLQLANDSFNESLVANDCCRKAFVSTVFLMCGSVVVPQEDNQPTQEASGGRYHMEINLHTESLAYNLDMLLSQNQFNWHMIDRSRATTLYLKGAEAISDMLVYIGAIKSKLALDNIVIARHFRNVINRQVNCINANLDKAVVASDRHIRAIKVLTENGKLNTLSDALQQVAKLRLDNPSDTLEELAVKCDASKSGVRHRLNKLVTLADEIDN